MSRSTASRTSKRLKRMRPVDKTFAKAFANYTPPASLTVSQWAERYRILSRESSAEAGPWRNSRTPYMVEPMDAFTDPRVKEITVVAMSQSSKSECELNMIGYIIDQDPGSLLYIQPNLGDAQKFSRLRIAPMIRDCPTLRNKVSDIKSRNSSNTTLQKSFLGGMLTIVGSQSPAALASTPARYVIGDEVDRWAASAGTEGDPWSLAVARTTTFYNAKMVAVSTPTIRGASKIADLYYEGTQEHWCTECPECGGWFNIVFDDIKMDYEKKEVKGQPSYKVKSVGWVCPECGTYHTEAEMRAQPQKWIADNPDAIDIGHRSFWVNAFASPWRTWDEICMMFLAAKDDPEKFKAFKNTILGELWEERSDIADENEMLARREDYGTNKDGEPVDLPDGVLVLTCGVDTQDAFFSFEVVGHGRFGETYGIRKGVVLGDPDDDDTWAELDKIIDRTYRFKDGTGMRISFTCIDSGGHKTQSVYLHCRDRMVKRVFAIKGQGGDGVPFTRPPSKVKIVVNGRAIGMAWLYNIGVDAGKATIMSSLRVQEAGPKYCHFPLDSSKGYDAQFFRELLSERMVLKTDRGRAKYVWERIPGIPHNEGLDARNYALAAFRILDPDLEAVQEALRNRREGKETETAEKPENKRPRVQRNKRLAGADDW